MDVNAALVAWFGTVLRDGHGDDTLEYRQGQWAVEAAARAAEARRMERLARKLR